MQKSTLRRATKSSRRESDQIANGLGRSERRGKKGLVGVLWIEMKYSGAMREDGGEKRPIEDH